MSIFFEKKKEVRPEQLGAFVNPRKLLLEPDGKKKLVDLMMVRAAYIPQDEPLKALCNSILRGTPLLTEGTRGSGKTAQAEALAESCGLRKFVLSCMSGLTIEDILFSWDTVAQDVAARRDPQVNIWTRDFLILGELLAGYDYAAQAENELPPLILIDEVDKLDEYTQDQLLQVLARGYANIPRLRPDSEIGVSAQFKAENRDKFPIVILTSNNMRKGVSPPVRSRCRFSYIEKPGKRESIRILLSKLQKAGFGQQRDLLTDMAKLMHGVGGKTLEESPELREYEELMITLCESGIERITADVLRNNLDTLAKSRKDIKIFQEAIDQLIYAYIDNEDPEIESFVSAAYEDFDQAQKTLALKSAA